MAEHNNSSEEIDFQNLMADVTPIKHERADIQKPATSRENLEYRRFAATTETQAFDEGLSDQLRDLVSSEDELIHARNGVQLRTMRRLRKGHIPWEEGLDLHGYGVDQAREELGLFIRQASTRGLRSVIVVHGKAHNTDGSPALLKSYCNDWLRQMPQVLAFVSAQPADGGTGALYVLLKSLRPPGQPPQA